jgi:type IV pilus assembly protein PilV
MVELMMSMLILTVGLLGLLQSIQIAYQHHARNRMRDEAVLLAEGQLASFRSSTSSLPLTVWTEKRSISGLDKKFTVTRRSEPVGGDIQRLTVAVRWGFGNTSTTHEIYTLKKKTR